MANINKTQAASAESWKGYSLEELKFQKALTVVKIDMKKQAISHRLNNLPQVMTNSIVNRLKMTLVGRTFGYVSKFFRK